MEAYLSQSKVLGTWAETLDIMACARGGFRVVQSVARLTYFLQRNINLLFQNLNNLFPFRLNNIFP